jgi:hypothetical protein
LHFLFKQGGWCPLTRLPDCGEGRNQKTKNNGNKLLVALDGTSARSGCVTSIISNVRNAKTNLPSAIYSQSLTSGRPPSAATQSSTYKNRGANLAIDKNAGTYSQTLTANGYWWMVDLGGPETVSTVYLQAGRSSVTTVQLLDTNKRLIATKQ